MAAPNSFKKLWIICSSVLPAACMRAIFSLAGLEKWHSSMLQVATESVHPHLQARRAPTRRTSTLGFSLAVCASAAAAIMRARKLLFNRCMFLNCAQHLGAGVLHFYFAGNQADQRAAEHHQGPDPDP